ncbi:hypothetical protein [Sharpea azabuensis]|uniref:hypothetical protein n=1 Tax=Sharpea azabuensis TaxID=322505 RepID=UPI001568A822|nr:hypothetical protein [Sharpea azabuensis]
MNIKGINTVICSILFVIAGALIIGFDKDNRASPSIFPGNMTTYANTQTPYIPQIGLPLDIQLDLNKRAFHDTVYVEKTDTVYKTKYKTKVRKVAAPEDVEKTDTLFVPVFYLTTPLEHEVESTELRIINDVHISNVSETNQTDSLRNE